MRTLIVLLFITISPVAYATDWGIPSDALENALPKDCDATSDAGLSNCGYKAFQKADAELNVVWRKVLASIDQDAANSATNFTASQIAEWKSDLIAAQKAWVTFKDMDCNGARSFEYWGGSGRGLAVLNCQFEYTIARRKDLEARYLQQ